MAIQFFNLSLKNAAFPLFTGTRGKAAMVPVLDQEPKGPQPYWVQNVMPVVDGYISVAYQTVVVPKAVANSTVIDNDESRRASRVFHIQSDNKFFTYIYITPYAINIYSVRDAEWKTTPFVNLTGEGKKTSVFFYKGRSFVFHPEIGLHSLTHDGAEFVLRAETTNGITQSALVGMTAVANYIVAIDQDTVYWSSPISGNTFGSTIEFDPDNVALAGAGASKILSLKGTAVMVVPKDNGFYIHTDENIISAEYTQQPANPWFFTEVKNSAGVFYPFHTTSANNSGIPFVWSSEGFAEITPQGLVHRFPEITEFLTGNYFEYWDKNLKEIRLQIGVQFEVQVNFLSGRYLTISYGKKDEIKDFLLVLDVKLQRWGKLAVKHLTVFDFVPPSQTLSVGTAYADYQGTISSGLAAELGYTTVSEDQELGYMFDTTVYEHPYSDFFDVSYAQLMSGQIVANFHAAAIGIMAPDFSMMIADFSDQTNKDSGLVLYGGINISRSRLTELNKVEVDGLINVDPIPEITIETRAPNRVDADSKKWAPAYYDSDYNAYNVFTVGKQPEVKIEGKFLLSDLVIHASISGRE